MNSLRKHCSIFVITPWSPFPSSSCLLACARMYVCMDWNDWALLAGLFAFKQGVVADAVQVVRSKPGI